MPKILPVHIESLATNEPVSLQEADALKKLIGISKGTISQDTEIQRFPLYILNSGKVLIGNLSNCFDVLWDNFEGIAKSDSKFYDRYQKYKSKWLESTGRNYLERIFPPESVYETLDYPNPDKSGTTELDLAVKWGPFLLLREWDDDNARCIAFALLNLENNLLAGMASAIEEIQDIKLPPLTFRRYSCANEEIVINVIASSTATLPELMDRLLFRATTEKYQRKLNKSISLGFMGNDTSKRLTFEGALYLESDWEENKDLEDLIANEPTSLPVVGTKWPGRNEPCICGSGKKYKKCCLREIEEKLNATSH